MPCTFDFARRDSGEPWRSRAVQLLPSMDQHFHVLLNNVGGGCGSCRETQNGIAWGSDSYVLCLRCATAHFNAPDLRDEAPELFAVPPVIEDSDDAEDTPESITTKRDKDFQPSRYLSYQRVEPLSGRHGCSGYRCESYPAPERTIPARTLFMMGGGSRGNLCMSCYNKLKEKYENQPSWETCNFCENRRASSRMQATAEPGRYARVCDICLRNQFINAPDTDGGYIIREGCVWAMLPSAIPGVSGRRVYASQAWAERHWFQGHGRWYTNQADADRELFAMDPIYRNDRIQCNASAPIFPYGTNVIKMHGFPDVTPKDSLCFGVELEMQANARSTRVQVVDALGGKFTEGKPYILCADSSLGAAGVEMITLPYTLANHKADKFMPWTKILADLRKVAKSGQDTTQCGMHVHINRRALSNLQMGKMLVVINAPEMQELIVTIAQRSEAAYCNRYVKKVADGGKIIGNHTDALNMSNSKGTVELRIFRGNLRYERVMKNLEFAEALCMYAQEQSVRMVHDPAALLSWLEDNKAHYPHLVKFLREEYRPTKAYARTAVKLRKNQQWDSAMEYLHVEPTEGDI